MNSKTIGFNKLNETLQLHMYNCFFGLQPQLKSSLNFFPNNQSMLESYSLFVISEVNTLGWVGCVTGCN